MRMCHGKLNIYREALVSLVSSTNPKPRGNSTWGTAIVSIPVYWVGSM